MGAHLINGEFQSDKYPTTPRGKVPLSVKDPTAQDLLWAYAQRRRSVDAEFSDDLEIALKSAGFEPPMASEIETFTCESCGKDFPIEEETGMLGDGHCCQACATEIGAVIAGCDHQFVPFTDNMGDDGRYCTRCTVFLRNEDVVTISN